MRSRSWYEPTGSTAAVVGGAIRARPMRRERPLASGDVVAEGAEVHHRRLLVGDDHLRPFVLGHAVHPADIGGDALDAGDQLVAHRAVVGTDGELQMRLVRDDVVLEAGLTAAQPVSFITRPAEEKKLGWHSQPTARLPA